ncbi:MAG: hypothetical protein OD918_00625 [Gammaproteobacteria bacterium]
MKSGTKKHMPANALAIALLFSAVTAHSAEKINPRSFCPPESKIPGQTILLVDTTDQLPALARVILEPVLKGLMSHENEHYVQRGHKLIAYYVGPQAEKLAAHVRVCNPGNPKYWSIWEKLFRGEHSAMLQWRKFVVSVGSILRELPPHNAQSPLLETIAWVIARHAPGIGVDKRKPTNLIVFSDMLQNSGRMSHYKTLPNIDDLENLPGYAEMKSDLKGVKVWIYYVRRPGLEHVQTREHFYWWTRVIKRFGATLVKQTPL